MKQLAYSLLAIMLMAACKPERPEPPKGEPRIFFPQQTLTTDTTAADASASSAADLAALEETVKGRTASIFGEVLRLYNQHKYTLMDQQALKYCTENVKRKYKAVMDEWNMLTDEEKEEYVEGPSLWWYFIGGNIDTRSGRQLRVEKGDMEIICLDSEMAMLRVMQKVDNEEYTYCKVFMRNVDGSWMIDDLIPEAVGGGAYSKSFMRDQW